MGLPSNTMPTVRIWVSAMMGLYYFLIAQKLHSLSSPKDYGVIGTLENVQTKPVFNAFNVSCTRFVR
jgi:hypothetical protein